jgi:hypothetical protein
MQNLIQIEGITLARVIPNIVNFKNTGANFFSENNDFLQVGQIYYPENHIIIPHEHLEVQNNISVINEVLILIEGKIEVNLYIQKIIKHSLVLNSGDAIVLMNGGHGFKMLEPSKIIEIKQGPYMGDLDKIRFNDTSK